MKIVAPQHENRRALCPYVPNPSRNLPRLARKLQEPGANPLRFGGSLNWLGGKLFFSCLAQNLLAQRFGNPETGVSPERVEDGFQGRQKSRSFCLKQQSQNPHSAEPQLDG